MNEAIKLAIEKGGYKFYGKDSIDFKNLENLRQIEIIYSKHSDGKPLSYGFICYEEIAFDPLFWQALGEALGNKDVMRCDSPKCDTVQCEYAGYKDPHRMFENYMNLKWYRGDEEAYWKESLN